MEGSTIVGPGAITTIILFSGRAQGPAEYAAIAGVYLFLAGIVPGLALAALIALVQAVRGFGPAAEATP